LRVPTNQPIKPPRRGAGQFSRRVDRLRDSVVGRARAVTTAAIPYYRRALPTGLRALIPDDVRRLLKWGLGVKDPIVQVHEHRHRLNDLGFVERALADLEHLAENSDAFAQQRATWFLAVWHANRRSPEGSAEALALLDRGLEDTGEPDMPRKEAVLRAECLATLGDVEAAGAVIEAALRDEPHADLHLAEANLYADPEERLARINKALRLYDLPLLSLRPDESEPLYDRLTVPETLPAAEGPKISVIVPAFDAAEHIATAMQALIAQTWRNLEVLVVDDLSRDSTADVVAAFSERDPRIKLIRAPANRGSYTARNIALTQATGAFVTTHDSDDWSHPRKLEVQARHLMSHPKAAANMSQQARATSELSFHRRGNAGFYIFDNMSSLMFRREPVTKKLGFWDPVRFGADSEFIERIRLAFGRNAVTSLAEAGPLSFQRQSESSLTASSAFGFHGFFMGARLAYHQASRRHHRAKRLYYDFPQETRPFAVPEPMWPKREVAKGERRKFDVVLVSDFRLASGFKARNLARVEEERRQGHRVGLVQMACYDFDPTARVQSAFLDLADRGEVHFVVVGEKVSCARLAVLHPPVLETFQRFVPEIEAEAVEVAVDEIPAGLSTPEAIQGWLERCRGNAERYFGSAGTWSAEDPSLAALLQPEANGQTGHGA
jgi:tetratricopeptide (TPR) repeat protein